MSLPPVMHRSVFQVPCTVDGSGNCTGNQHFGNVGRNAFVAPDYKNFDFSLVKDNKITERLKMQLRVDNVLICSLRAMQYPR